MASASKMNLYLRTLILAVVTQPEPTQATVMFDGFTASGTIGDNDEDAKKAAEEIKGNINFEMGEIDGTNERVMDQVKHEFNADQNDIFDDVLLLTDVTLLSPGHSKPLHCEQMRIRITSISAFLVGAMEISQQP